MTTIRRPIMIFLCNALAGLLISSIVSASQLEGIEWLLVEVGGAAVAPPAGNKQPSLTLDAAQKKATGYSGCNNFFSTYRLDGASLTFGPIGMTRRACPDPETGMETAFLRALESTNGWKLTDGVLLLLHDQAGLARLKPAVEGKTGSEQQITGPVWQWVRTIYNNDTKTVPEKPEHYTIRFLENGTIAVKADCNQKGGTFTTEGKKLAIKITHSTMAACEAGSLEDQFVRDLSGGAGFFFKDADLFIDLKYDSGTMRFTKMTE